MAQTRSQDYDVDNRYSQSQINGTPARDNTSGENFLRNYLQRDKVAKKNPIAPDNRDENKFILPGQGGLIPIPDGGSVSNTDSRMTFRNSFRASQKEPS
jgi:hypothetical protein